ncbi:MAG: outer membrane beta-barrel protein [Limnobacter sp.]|uniref:outer membrane beta-barrel protein n=1 Tax=Limnobacter sp. TaxID=2003368 RepID=UPI00391C4D92
MKKIIAKAALFVLASGVTVTCFANPYFGAKADRIQVNVDGVSLNYGGARVTGGYQLTDHFAVEGHVGTGVSDAKIAGQTSQLGTYYGVDLVGKLPVTEKIYARANVGYGSIEIDGIKDNDIRFGVGAGYQLSANTDLTFSLERWYSKEGVTINSLNTGVSYKF